MKSLMHGVVAFGTGKPAAAVVGAGGKTGTSDNNRDAWFVGFTNRHVSGIWMGIPENQSMRGIGGTAASAIWAKAELSLPTE